MYIALRVRFCSWTSDLCTQELIITHFIVKYMDKLLLAVDMIIKSAKCLLFGQTSPLSLKKKKNGIKGYIEIFFRPFQYYHCISSGEMEWE